MLPTKLPGEDFIYSWYPILIAMAIGTVFALRSYMRGPPCPSDKSLRSKVAIVTGANSGIGKEIAKDFSQRGARVIMACRDLNKANKSIEDIKLVHKKANIIAYQLDLASFQSIRDFVKTFQKEESRLDILVNNAGIICHPDSITKDGYEIHFGVNYLGHFLLTMLLKQDLAQSKAGRVVNVTALAYQLADSLDFDLFTPGRSNSLITKDSKADGGVSSGGEGGVSSAAESDGEERCGEKEAKNLLPEKVPSSSYSQSKFAVVLSTIQLAKYFQDKGVSVNCVHPGIVRTDAHKHMAFMSNTFLRYSLSPFYYLLMKSPYDGAQTAIHVAVADEEEGVTGKLYKDCQIYSYSNNVDDDLAKEVFEEACKLFQIVI